MATNLTAPGHGPLASRQNSVVVDLWNTSITVNPPGSLLRHSTFEALLPAFVWLAIWLSLLPLSTNELLTSDTALKQNEFLGEIVQRGKKSRTETAEL
jgi:hypothetical protein